MTSTEIDILGQIDEAIARYEDREDRSTQDPPMGGREITSRVIRRRGSRRRSSRFSSIVNGKTTGSQHMQNAITAGAAGSTGDRHAA